MSRPVHHASKVPVGGVVGTIRSFSREEWSGGAVAASGNGGGGVVNEGGGSHEVLGGGAWLVVVIRGRLEVIIGLQRGVVA